ncbi:MAG: hypothetical protein IAF38_18200 [Bacteroidia bacterium]|nr:hypothetical protein [Bacteroidia bacterium]
MKATANIFSIIFHPSLLPTWLVFIILFFVNRDLRLEDSAKKLVFTGTFFFFTGILPVINVLILQRFGYITNLQMEDRKERTMPYTIGLVYYGGLFYLIYNSDLPDFFKALVATGFLLILFTLIVNLKWKISAHAIGAGGFAAAMFSYSWVEQHSMLLWICLAFFVAACSCFARLYLKKHSPQQVYLGFLGGFFIAAFSIRLVILFFQQ